MVIQSDVYTIILLTIIIGIAIVVLSKKIDALDPLENQKEFMRQYLRELKWYQIP